MGFRYLGQPRVFGELLGTPKSKPLSTYVLSLQPLAFWKMIETTGTIAADSQDGYTGAYEGTYTLNGTQNPSGLPAPTFTAGAVNVYSAGFGTAFNFDEFSVFVLAKVSAAADWTDATYREFWRFLRDSGNFVYLRKTTTNNQIHVQRRGNTGSVITISLTISQVTWMSLLVTGSISAGRMRLYLNGVQQGSDTAISDAAAGSGLSLTGARFAAADGTFSEPWKGAQSFGAVWTRELSAAEAAGFAIPT